MLLTIQYRLSSQQYIYLNDESGIRFEKALQDNKNLHSACKPFLLSDSIQLNSTELLSLNSNNKTLDKLLNNNLLSFESKNFNLGINPIVTIAPEYETNSKSFFNNYNFGLVVEGQWTKKLFFQVNGFYGIRSFPEYYQNMVDSLGVIPHYGEYIEKKGTDFHYFSINGHLSYSPWKYLNLNVGIGKNFWGDGYRSLLLSDNSSSYPFFKATVDVWRFKYIWLFGALRDHNSDYQDNQFRNKLLFSHFLSWNATSWLNLNLFESIISNPVDTLGLNYFNVNYLNPVIFLRPVEFSGGSADNALLGFGLKLKLWKKYQFYGQFTFDEFVFSELKSGDGWWGNKFAFQAGIKIFDLFTIKNLFGRIEVNQIRPYTYSYSNSILNYGAYYQPLAHPSGANLEEYIFNLHYHYRRFSAEIKFNFSQAGMDTDSVNNGKDIYKSYLLRKGDYQNNLKQGFKGEFTNLLLKSAWIINPKINFNIFLTVNHQKILTPVFNQNYTCISLGISTLLFNNNYDFF